MRSLHLSLADPLFGRLVDRYPARYKRSCSWRAVLSARRPIRDLVQSPKSWGPEGSPVTLDDRLRKWFVETVANLDQAASGGSASLADLRSLDRDYASRHRNGSDACILNGSVKVDDEWIVRLRALEDFAPSLQNASTDFEDQQRMLTIFGECRGKGEEEFMRRIFPQGSLHPSAEFGASGSSTWGGATKLNIRARDWFGGIIVELIQAPRPDLRLIDVVGWYPLTSVARDGYVIGRSAGYWTRGLVQPPLFGSPKRQPQLFASNTTPSWKPAVRVAQLTRNADSDFSPGTDRIFPNSTFHDEIDIRRWWPGREQSEVFEGEIISEEDMAFEFPEDWDDPYL
jgi:hypothetical protein